MRLTFTLSCLVVAAVLNAQNLLTVVTEDGEDVTNGSAIVLGDAAQFEMGLPLSVTLNGSTDRTVRMKRYESSVVPGTYNYFCWSECYAPQLAGDIPFWVAPDPQTLSAGVQFNGFHAYHRPSSLVGESCFRYVWYASDNANDSVFVDICFDAQVVGVNEADRKEVRFAAQPNPVESGDVTFTFDALGSARSSLVVRNALGAVHLSIPVLPGQKSIVLGSDRLGSGIWFASLEQNGREVATRRVVVSGN
ncbi:MAG: hypothetical protein U0U25_06350 [Flavobacteriales bacterium]